MVFNPQEGYLNSAWALDTTQVPSWVYSFWEQREETLQSTDEIIKDANNNIAIPICILKEKEKQTCVLMSKQEIRELLSTNKSNRRWFLVSPADLIKNTKFTTEKLILMGHLPKEEEQSSEEDLEFIRHHLLILLEVCSGQQQNSFRYAFSANIQEGLDLARIKSNWNIASIPIIIKYLPKPCLKPALNLLEKMIEEN